ncbi:MAG: hypothetical protein Q4F29_12080 [Lachnospiraceae bacterium]|nr:hypothetical protein [Lachnospiraceae bacterium]
MNIEEMLTPGTILFLAGILVLTAALIFAVVLGATGGSRKRKMEERMREKY